MQQQTRLVAKSQRGDKRAYERLFDAHRESIFRLIWHQVSDRELAEELTVETFVRAWEALPRLGTPEAFGAWLRRIALNQCRDALRRRMRRPATSSETEQLERQPAPGDASSGVLQDELSGAVQAAVGELPEHYREVAVLFYMDDQPVKEISEILGIPVGTVLSRLARARDALRKKLVGYVVGSDE